MNGSVKTQGVAAEAANRIGISFKFIEPTYYSYIKILEFENNGIVN